MVMEQTNSEEIRVLKVEIKNLSDKVDDYKAETSTNLTELKAKIDTLLDLNQRRETKQELIERDISNLRSEIKEHKEDSHKNYDNIYTQIRDQKKANRWMLVLTNLGTATLMAIMIYLIEEFFKTH